MKNLSEPADLEFVAIQNDGLAAILLCDFCEAFYDKKAAPKRGPELPVVMPILPLLFNGHVTSQLCKRNFSGGLFRALSDDRSLILGLQKRMVNMANQTMAALDLAFAADLLTYDAASTCILPTAKKVPKEFDCADTKAMRAASRRLGIWFAEIPVEQLAYLLGLRF